MAFLLDGGAGLRAWPSRRSGPVRDPARGAAAAVVDDRITGLTETADGVHVTFLHGPGRVVDLVVAADGPRSRTRDLVLAVARGRTVGLRPDNLGTTRGLPSFRRRRGGPAGARGDAGVDHREAFASYDRVLRPYVDRARKLPPGAPRIADPRTALWVRVFDAVMTLASSGPARWVAGRFASPPARDFELPTYPVARV